MSQSALASRLGITFQQVQKYEKGANRVGASRLQAIAGIFEVHIGYFFSDYEGRTPSNEHGEPSAADNITRFLTTRDGIALNRAFLKIKSPVVRRSIIKLAKALADGHDDATLEDFGETVDPEV